MSTSTITPVSSGVVRSKLSALPSVRERSGGLERSSVVVPSRTIEKWEDSPAECQAYEERLLCSLLELRDPSLRMTYVTSSQVAPAIIDYYLSLLPRRVRRDARRRLTLVAAGEASARPLSRKLLDRPTVVDRIRHAIPDPARCHLVPYTTTALEQELADALGIPMYGAAPRHAHLGTKSGCRELFARVGVPHPAGVEGIASQREVVQAIVSLRRRDPVLSRVVVKLNDGVSGEGNAIVELAGLPSPGDAGEASMVAERVANLRPDAPGVSAARFLLKLAAGRGVVEQWITGRELRSPSAQLQITPEGEVQLVSTHDQILGGPSGQTYLGCRFPAAPEYAPAIGRLALRVGAALAAAGVIGRLAIDFVVTRDEHGAWHPYAIELNLRKGGTTHPYDTLVNLTGGLYDAETGVFMTPLGQTKHYVATDHLESPALHSIGCDVVLALARRGALRFDRLLGTGPVFHMLSAIEPLGRVGVTAIADSADAADALYAGVQQLGERVAALGRGAASPPAAAAAVG